MKKTDYKILLLVPSPASHGGVANYFSALKDQFSNRVSYFYRGVRKQNSARSRFFYPVVQVWDYMVFFFMIMLNRYALVHINTSFGKTGIIRDYFFIKILQLLGQKYVVFFRGIDEKVIQWIENRWFKAFSASFLKADGILVLSSYLKDKILGYGYKGMLRLETTVVDPALTEKLSYSDIFDTADDEKIRLLFLARMEKAKGVYEAIEAWKILKNKQLNVELVICGDGSEFFPMTAYVKENCKNDSIHIKGHVRNQEKKKVFLNADIYLFPSSHQEGLPNSLLEAMAFGLPVITSNVGGIPDFFQEGKMGFMMTDITPQTIADFVEVLFHDPEKRIQMSRFNFAYAKSHFYADRVVGRLENFYQAIITCENHS
jgi:glycosyltransferase involved in cell wall biosynthesis